MRIRDTAIWQQQKAEIAQGDDSQIGEAFMRFVESWCDRAEKVMAETHDEYFEGDPRDGTERFVTEGDSPLESLRETLQPTEAEFGALPAQWTAQMLLVIAACWGHGGDELFEEMTVFEKKMVADMASLVNVKAQEGAVDVSTNS
jgi:hypothetical protein